MQATVPLDAHTSKYKNDYELSIFDASGSPVYARYEEGENVFPFIFRTHQSTFTNGNFVYSMAASATTGCPRNRAMK
jgi:hypothetical protein